MTVDSEYKAKKHFYTFQHHHFTSDKNAGKIKASSAILLH